MEVSKKRSSPGYCGVPQCKTRKSSDTHLFKIPVHVRRSSALMNKWSKILGIKKPLPKLFLICHKHFESKCILKKLSITENSKVRLSQNAIPCRNLPIFSSETESAVTEETKSEEDEVFPKCGESNKNLEWVEDKLSDEGEEIFAQDKENEEEPNIRLCDEKVQDEEWLEFSREEDFIDLEGQKWVIETIECKYNSIGIQCSQEVRDKEVQVNNKPYISIPSLWDTDRKLNTMTGISRMKILNVLVEICQDIRPNEKCPMSLKDRICLTMYKLKSNCSFAEVAVFFQTTDPTAKLYFGDTIQLLAKAMKGLIHWQTKEQNKRSLPECFKSFPNVRTVLDCTEIKTATLNCLCCRESTCTHYKGVHTLKFLIGVSPSGSINYISKVVTGKSSDKASFDPTDLVNKLEQGDAIVVDKGFLIGDELTKAGIEMIRPDMYFKNCSKSDVEKNTQTASTRVHFKRRIARIKQFRVLRDKICASMIPYIDDIVVVLCGLSNISPIILSDKKFYR